MTEDKPIHERVSKIEARCEVIVPDMKERIEKIEVRSEQTLMVVTEINTMLKKNGFGKGKTNGGNMDIEVLKLQTKVSRWINGILIGGIAIIVALIGVVVVIVGK
jgi:hypothetical protein